MKRCILMTALICLLAINLAEAEDGVSLVVNPTPIGENSCISVEIAHMDQQALSGLRWFHNDGSLPFPKLLLLEGMPGTPPDLEDTALILDQISGASLSWGVVDLEFPVQSSTGLIHAVFVFPPNVATIGQGVGGGPALGIRHESGGPPFYLSADGVQWAQFDPSYALAVDPILSTGGMSKTAGKSTVKTLKSLKGESSLASEKPPVIIEQTRLHLPQPNPFNPRTVIRYDLAAPGMVEISIYNARGQRVQTLVSQEMPQGEHRAVWLGKDESGSDVASGVYYLRMEAGGQSYRQKMLLVR